MQKSSGKLSLYDAIINVLPETTEAPPQELATFRNLSRYQQMKDAEVFFKQGYICEYLDKKWKTELKNRENYLWLLDAREIYKDDFEKMKEINKRITVFADFLSKQENQFRALVVDVTKELQNEKEEIEWQE